MFNQYKRWFHREQTLFSVLQYSNAHNNCLIGFRFFFAFMLIPDRSRRNEGKWMTCKTYNGFTRISITLYWKLCEHIRAQMGKDKAANLEKKYIT